MKFNIELNGAEGTEEVERLVAALVVLYELKPAEPQPSITESVGQVSRTVSGDAAAVEKHVHPLGDGPAESVSTDSDLPAITTSRPPPPVVPQPEEIIAEIRSDLADLQIDTSALGFGNPTMQVPPPPPTGEVDSAGVRWDPALHAANKAKKGDGTWKAKRGLAPEVAADAQRVANIPPPPPATSVTGAPAEPVDLFEWADKQGITIARLQAAFKTVGLVDANGEGSIPLLLSRPEFTAAVYGELSK